MTSELVASKKMTLFGKQYDRGEEVPAASELPMERLRVLQSVGLLVPAVSVPKTKTKKEATSG